MRLLRRNDKNLSTEDRACLEGRAEAESRLRADGYVEIFMEPFVFGDIGTVLDVGQPDLRWVGPLNLPDAEVSRIGELASAAYFKCFTVAVFESANDPAIFTELVDAKARTEELFPDLTPEQQRLFAVNLWRGARAQGVRVRDARPDGQP